ncbi:metallophosphoesterase [Halorubellus salinus]|uniref:metallophosphoesterase n=1 Tax=Halorubellus salinus TaxID=755309 RepID=UPI001D065F5A|nr:metallophosphoesterase [Halorubellus salinus]
MADVYYFVSDLHVGGDEQLEQVDFLDELLAFLDALEERDEDAELIINGDAFGLWEFTEVEGPEKFDALLERYPELFEQFERTGREIEITLIPGNHDYELAAYPEYVERLAEYNVTLEQTVSIERPVGESLVHVEHGMQEDPNNRIPDFGNPYANPPGYFVNRQITSRAGQLSGRGKYNWLKDIQAVTPMTEIPDWLISNYFYREMSSWLRFSVVPFLLLFNVGVLYVALFALDWFDVWSLPLTLVEELLGSFGPAGRLVELVLGVNLVIIVLLLAISVPLAVFVWDARRTLRRFGLVRSPTDREPVEKYLGRARDVFASEPRVAVYVYGHTHRPSATEVDGRLVVNTGTWLKRLQRVDPLLGVLPPVYYASYQLNYFRLSAADDGDVLVEYEVIEKRDPDDETLLQRLLTRSPRRRRELPDRTVVNRPRERDSQLDESEGTE